NVNEYSEIQNHNAKAELYSGFTGKVQSGKNVYEANKNEMEAIRKLSAEILVEYQKATNFDTFLANAKAKISGSAAVSNQLKDDSKTSLQGALAAWVDSNRFN
ncbi:MAG: hypothetical protein IKA76_04655, partial [Clostridia bacterium]|nr:hypothetical protein [Clostridia bacterium]